MRLADLFLMARANVVRARLRAFLTGLGVAIGTAAVVTLISVGTGAQAIFVHQAGTYGQLTSVLVFPSMPGKGEQGGQFHALTPATLATIARLPHVAGVGAELALPALRLSEGGRARVLDARGVTPLDNSPAALALPLVTGATAQAGGDGVLVPASAARALGLTPAALVGRAVTLTAGGSVCCTASMASGTGLVVTGPDRRYAARVAGVYQDQGGATGSQLVVAAPLGARIAAAARGMAATTYLDRQGYALVVAVSDDARQTSALATHIGALAYRTRDRADLLSSLHLVFTILTGGLGAIGGIALLVAAVGIANTLIMTILERTREIGIMKALGAEPRMVRWLFLVETALVGLVGGVVGLILAALVGVLGNAVFQVWLRGQGITERVGSLFVIPALLAVGAVVLAVVVSLLAAAWPSRRAVNLQPLDALRYE